MNWLVLALITFFMWGIWAFLVKVIFHLLDWKEYFVLSGIGGAAVVLAVYAYFRPAIDLHKGGVYYALLTGILGVAAIIPFYLALGSGKAAIIVPLTALYPVVTLMLSLLILQEKVTLLQAVGIILALVAIILMSS